MTDLFYYLIKVMACSGILYLYYLIALRNKLFHQWNRFYLLMAVLLSLTVPVLQFTIWQKPTEQNSQAIELLTVVGSANNYLDEVTISSQSSISVDQWIIFAYVFVSSVLFVIACISLVHIIRIIKTHSVSVLNRIKFINTNVKGTPFSFMQFIFWNSEIDLQSETGRQIFQHELVHVKEKHTLDKLFLQLVLIFFWCNPFFWLIRKELRIIHEFIADKKSIAEHGTAALAAMILQSAYPNQFNSITNQFFQTSIKRRLIMLAKIQNPRINYISRLIALPLIAFTVLAFTLRTKKEQVPLVPLDKKITVVIDAGHGKMTNGGFNGARAENIYEDEIVLAIAQKIKSLNSNQNINVVLTRSSEEIVDLKKRVEIANEVNADIFISIHVNALTEGSSTSTPDTGFEVYLPGRSTTYQKANELLGSALTAELNKVYPTNTKTLQKSVGSYVLNNNPRPSVMIECGYITNAKDRSFITKEENQNAIALKILAAIQNYAASAETSSIKNPVNGSSDQIKSVDVDTEKQKISITYKDGKKRELSAGSTSNKKPLYVVDGKIFKGDIKDIDASLISNINVLKDGTAIKKYGEKGKNGVIEINTKKPVIYVDGIEYFDDINKIDPNTIASVNVLKNESAIEKYGDKGRNGVIEIITQKASDTVEDTIPKVVLVRAEIAPAIDNETWNNFLSKASKPVFEKAAKSIPAGTYVVQIKFIVNTDGNLSQFKVIKDHHGLGEMVLPEFKSAPKWQPALKNGKPVATYHTQPVTFVIENKG